MISVAFAATPIGFQSLAQFHADAATSRAQHQQIGIFRAAERRAPALSSSPAAECRPLSPSISDGYCHFHAATGVEHAESLRTIARRTTHATSLPARRRHILSATMRRRRATDTPRCIDLFDFSIELLRASAMLSHRHTWPPPPPRYRVVIRELFAGMRLFACRQILAGTCHFTRRRCRLRAISFSKAPLAIHDACFCQPIRPPCYDSARKSPTRGR